MILIKGEKFSPRKHYWTGSILNSTLKIKTMGFFLHNIRCFLNNCSGGRLIPKSIQPQIIPTDVSVHRDVSWNYFVLPVSCFLCRITVRQALSCLGTEQK